MDVAVEVCELMVLADVFANESQVPYINIDTDFFEAFALKRFMKRFTEILPAAGQDVKLLTIVVTVNSHQQTAVPNNDRFGRIPHVGFHRPSLYELCSSSLILAYFGVMLTFS